MSIDVRNKIIPDEDKTKRKIWYSWKSGGFLPTKIPIKYLIDFTIRYDSVSLAENGFDLPKSNSEFSIRVWKSDIGLISPTESDLNVTYKLYQQLLNNFGSFGEFPCE